MILRIGRRNFIRLISFILAVLLTFAVYAVVFGVRAGKYHQSLQNDYSAALSDLTEYLSTIDVTLQKQIYASTPTQMSVLSSQLSKEAGGAKSAISRLPVPNSDSSGIYRFLSQVGNYSLSLAAKAAAGEQISDDERENLNRLSDYAGKLSAKVSDLNAVLDGSALWDGEIKYALSGLDDSGTSEIAAAAENIAQTVTNYPTLIYDGPFSDHIDRKTPAYTADKLTVSHEQAKAAAAKYLDCDRSKLTDAGDESSITPAYLFSCGERICAITKEGGALLYISSGRNIGSRTVSEKDAISLAGNYLSKKLELEFKESYYIVENGICTVNFACLQDGVICYCDLIKVGVALDNGTVEEVEARGFIMNHHTRQLNQPKYSVEKAKSLLSSALTPKSASLCLINQNGTDEKLCYEFVCIGNNSNEVLVYINADTLEEENILLVQRTDGGVLTK